MCEQDFDLLAIFARLTVGIGVGELTRHLARGFVDAARYLARRGVRAALGLERAEVALAAPAVGS
jgi:hypothetical protein